MRCVDEPDHRPGGYLIIGGRDHGDIVPGNRPPPVTGIGCLSVYRFNNVIPSVKSLVTYQLYPDFAVAKLFNGKDCHVLRLVPVENRTKYNCVILPVDIVRHSKIIDVTVIVQVEVIDPGVLIVEVSFESFKRLRLLEKLHDCVEVQVVTRETQVFLRIILPSGYRR